MDTMQLGCQNMIFATMNAFHTANQIFDNTLNASYHMALSTEQDNNKSYIFKQMLQQEDQADYVKAMMKEGIDHEAKGHWEVVPRLEKLVNVKSIFAIWGFKRKRYQEIPWRQDLETQGTPFCTW